MKHIQRWSTVLDCWRQDPMRASTYGYERLRSEDHAATNSEKGCSSSDRTPKPTSWRFEVVLLICSLAWLAILFLLYPFPATIPLFITITSATLLWFAGQSIRGLVDAHQTRAWPVWSKWRQRFYYVCGSFTLLVLVVGVMPPEADPIPVLHPSVSGQPERYFIAANLFNNVAILPRWTTEMRKLIAHLGEDRVFLSIAESESTDKTPELLADFRRHLADSGIPHRVLTENTNVTKDWPYGKSPQRINYLAALRNKALQPLQSLHADIRYEPDTPFTKLIFLNDVVFAWEDVIRLLATREDGDASKPSDYDQVCATDFGYAGLYDTWVAHDRCGVRSRPYWPYFADPYSVERIKKELPLQVAACWNGITALAIEPFLPMGHAQESVAEQIAIGQRSSLPARDGLPDSIANRSLSTEEVQLPLRFHSTPNPACDASECFLLSYDLHRLHRPNRPPRILINPKVRVAYEWNWYHLHNTIYRIPLIRGYLDWFARWFGLFFVDFLWEYGRKASNCTWPGMYIPEDCAVREA